MQEFGARSEEPHAARAVTARSPLSAAWLKLYAPQWSCHGDVPKFSAAPRGSHDAGKQQIETDSFSGLAFACHTRTPGSAARLGNDPQGGLGCVAKT